VTDGGPRAPEFLLSGVATSAPSFFRRLFAVWRRFQRVYCKNLAANGLPPFLEPLFFLFAVGLGLGGYIGGQIGGISYAAYMAPGIPAMSAMFTASFETTFGTLVRLQYAKIYEALSATPATVAEIFCGEILWCATKGAFFAGCILLVLWCFDIGRTPSAPLILIVAFFTAAAFAGLGFIITSMVRQFNAFNFYITGFLSPMAFFSGLLFPVEDLPSFLPTVAWALPLSHVIVLMRACLTGGYAESLWPHALYLLVFTAVSCLIGVKLLLRRISP
jgi:lipooligosaccharide transport system permease protein